MDYSFQPTTELEKALQKPAAKFTRRDIMDVMTKHDIRLLNFRYAGGDGKLKLLNFAPSNQAHLESILTFGERVDGSSLFQHIDNASSDLYVIPLYRTAFMDPFTDEPTLSIFCTFFTAEGMPLQSAPQYVMQQAYEELQKRTSYQFKMLAELEYYIRGPKDEIFKGTDQKGYHASAPFAKYEYIRQAAIDTLVQCGGRVKYGHSEVGTFSTENYLYEQHEIEFLPEEPELAIFHLLLAKWILRMYCKQDELSVSWAPKICEGKAGSGLHFHMQLEKEGKNKMLENGELTEDAKRVIAGIMDMADILTAFGNTIPTSYLRLVPGQEAPTYVCWGYRNRSALVRVPLGWTKKKDMAKLANPLEMEKTSKKEIRQTVEFRVPDGSADVYLLAAGLITAATHGLTMPNALELADKTFVSKNIFSPDYRDKLKTLKQLPTCCTDSGHLLIERQAMLEQFGAFKPELIKSIANNLIKLNDKELNEKLTHDPQLINQIVTKYMDTM